MTAPDESPPDGTRPVRTPEPDDLELAWQTMGTAEVSGTVIHAWVAELLTSPYWGVVHYAENVSIKAIFDIAQLHGNAASGHTAPIAAWGAADHAARAAARAIDPMLNAAGLYAVRAAHQSTAPLDTDHGTALDAVTGHALRAHALAAAGTASTRAIELARGAIRSWRYLAVLDNPGDINRASVESALQRILVSA